MTMRGHNRQPTTTIARARNSIRLINNSTIIILTPTTCEEYGKILRKCHVRFFVSIRFSFARSCGPFETVASTNMVGAILWRHLVKRCDEKISPCPILCDPRVIFLFFSSSRLVSLSSWRSHQVEPARFDIDKPFGLDLLRVTGRSPELWACRKVWHSSFHTTLDMLMQN